MKIKIAIKEEKNKKYKSHKMYNPDPNSKDVVVAKSKEDHEKYKKKGYIHIDPKKIRKIIGPDEGGAAGIKALEKALPDFSKKEIEDALKKMDDIGEHEHGDYVLKDDEVLKTKDQILIKIIAEEIRFVLEKRKKRKKKKKKKKSSGKKDACYHKVKSRYKVWPSAYASGALVRCRKVGAKNWGNKSKKK
tara:strand:+ start:1130 stop:1699 length:570 start_codon:yes stop_codon:yes gene_type:complete